MATRIEVKPDSDGIIRVVCGGTLLEIVVAPGDAASGPIIPPEDPFGKSTAYMAVEARVRDQFDVEAIVSRLDAETRAPDRPTPIGVLLRTEAVDLRGIAGLKEAMVREGYDVPVAVDLHARGAASSEDRHERP